MDIPAPLTADLQALRSALQEHIPEVKLTKYMSAFYDNYCETCDIVATLRPDELKELGVAVGHRKRVLVAAAMLATPALVLQPYPGRRSVPAALRNPLSTDSSSDDRTNNVPCTSAAKLLHRDASTIPLYPHAAGSSSIKKGVHKKQVVIKSPLAAATDLKRLTHTSSTIVIGTPMLESSGSSGEDVPTAEGMQQVSTYRRGTHAVNQGHHGPPSSLQSQFLSDPRLSERTSTSSRSNNTSRHSSFRQVRRAGHGGGRSGLQAAESVYALNRLNEELSTHHQTDPSHNHMSNFVAFTESDATNIHEAPSTTVSPTSAVHHRRRSMHRDTLISPGSDNTSGEGVEWLRLSGNRPTLDQFLYEMNALRKYRGFPPSFDRLFYNNKPMPFVEMSLEGDMVGILLRIPDLSDEFGTSITTITNRVCFMVHFDARLIVTYHACEEDPLDGFQKEWESGRHATTSVERLAETMIRQVLRTYNKGLAALRDVVDDLESRDPSAASKKLTDTAQVQKLSVVAKKAAVYKRCADATRDALNDLEDIEDLEPYVKTLTDSLSTVASMAEELTSNALGSIDLTIAISEFKSNANMKMFSFMSILLQPVSLATSWYGMNWSNMPELMYEEAYYYFSGLVWVVAFVVFGVFVLHETFLDRLFALTAPPGVVAADTEEGRPWSRSSIRLASSTHLTTLLTPTSKPIQTSSPPTVPRMLVEDSDVDHLVAIATGEDDDDL